MSHKSSTLFATGFPLRPELNPELEQAALAASLRSQLFLNREPEAAKVNIDSP